MTGVRIAALVFAALSAGLILFQLALAAGAPWGAYAMGGAFPGTYPPPMRVAAVVQAAITAVLALVILARAGLTAPGLRSAARWPAWATVGLMGLALAANLITPSGGERVVWTPVAGLMFLASLRVALGC